MPIKGTIGTDHYPKNEYSFAVVGLPPLTVTKIGELETELETADLPDRRVVTGGNTKALESDFETPSHHDLEQALWEKWFSDSQFPAAPDYKKTGVLSLISSQGLKIQSWTLFGVFPKKRSVSEQEMANEGEPTMTTWTLSIDEALQG